MYIYIHIPFCNNICSYCDFAKVYYNKNFVNNYLKALEKEIKQRYKNELIKSIYIGGGTPTCLNIDELKQLLEITNIFKKDKEIEFSIESNIEITKNKIILLKEYNVNRISLGVQSFNNDILKILNRTHNKDMILNTINLLKENRFNNINIDLIYGVTEDINIIKKDIDYFLDLDINHISCYSLILEENTILNNNKYKPINEDIEYEMYKYIENKLTNNSYIHYEISNYSKNKYQSIHNTNYWLNGNYYGFGLGAVSYLNNYRITNTRNLTKYINNNYIENKLYEDKNTRMKTEIMLGLRLINGLNINEFKNKYHKNIFDVININNYIKDNILIIDNNYLKVNKEYIYLLNEILVNILK